jgi:RecA/RadA recombinase
MYKLRNLIQRNNIAVVITNQSTSNPDTQSKIKDPQPFGGKAISYTSSTYMSTTLDARLVKSPLRGYGWHPLSITESGFYDINFVDT